MKKYRKKFTKKDRFQRAEKPDELMMICHDKPAFGKRLVDAFKQAKAGINE